MTNTDHRTLGWAIIWTCIKTIYKQCNWPGSGGDAEKWTGWQILVPYQQKGFINFSGCNWIFERFLLSYPGFAHPLHWPSIDLQLWLLLAFIALGREIADGIYKEKKKQAATFKIDSTENNKTTSLRLCNFPLEKKGGGLTILWTFQLHAEEFNSVFYQF